MFLLLWSLTQQKCDSDSQFVHLPAKTSTLLANSMVSLQRLPINYTQIRRGLWEFLRYDNLQTGIGFMDGLAGGLVLWMHSLTDGVVCSVLDPPTISVHKRSVNESLTAWTERVCGLNLWQPPPLNAPVSAAKHGPPHSHFSHYVCFSVLNVPRLRSKPVTYLRLFSDRPLSQFIWTELISGETLNVQ